MWVAKFSYNGESTMYGSASKKFNVILRGFALGSYEEGNKYIVTTAGKIIGNKENIKKAINFFKKSKYYLRLEEKNDFLILTIKEDLKFKQFYSSSFIYISPVVIENGVERFHIGSWNRKDIEGLLKKCEKYPNFKLESLKQEKIDNISITGMEADLTEKQKKAYKLAVENGYYEYPKKIHLKKLASKMGVSYSTFQQHLSYAEKKVHNFILGRIS